MKQPSRITREAALELARKLRESLLAEHIPVRAVMLYGSFAKEAQHEGSDIDIAIICDPFRASRHEENMEVRRIRRMIDVRISPLCLHPDDLKNTLWRLPREVYEQGIAV